MQMVNRVFAVALEVNMALRTLTLLFIGGASSTAELLSCQAEDGGAANASHYPSHAKYE